MLLKFIYIPNLLRAQHPDEMIFLRGIVDAQTKLKVLSWRKGLKCLVNILISSERMSFMELILLSSGISSLICIHTSGTSSFSYLWREPLCVLCLTSEKILYAHPHLPYKEINFVLAIMWCYHPTTHSQLLQSR